MKIIKFIYYLCQAMNIYLFILNYALKQNNDIYYTTHHNIHISITYFTYTPTND